MCLVTCWSKFGLCVCDPQEEEEEPIPHLSVTVGVATNVTPRNFISKHEMREQVWILRIL